jgi:hypothetical protein
MVAFALLEEERGVVEGRPSFEALSRWRGIMDRAEYSPAHKGHLNANLLHRASEPQKGDDDDVQEVPLAGGYSSDDVLQGRGKGVSKHRGNRRFRKVIKNCSLPYSRAQNNTARRQVVDRVLATIHEKGRFLEPSGDDTLWIELTDKKVREKISQVRCLKLTQPLLVCVLQAGTYRYPFRFLFTGSAIPISYPIFLRNGRSLCFIICHG